MSRTTTVPHSLSMTAAPALRLNRITARPARRIGWGGSRGPDITMPCWGSKVASGTSAGPVLRARQP